MRQHSNLAKETAEKVVKDSSRIKDRLSRFCGPAFHEKLDERSSPTAE
jgi:hypothetical protein